MTCYNRCVLEFRILGSLEVLDDGRPLPLGGRNQRALLALLLLRANEPVSRERLVDQLWCERPPRTATTSLQNAGSQLRKLLGKGLLLTRPTGYMLQIDADQLDLTRFERLVREARASAPEERAARFRAALELWHGPALADLEQETFAQSEIQRLEDLRVDALAAFHDARRTLVEELGIEPGPQLQNLYGAILRQERALVRIAPPALEDHYDEVIRAFSAGRLVPVLGPGVGGVAGHELATLLAERFELEADGRGLAYISQAVAARNGIGPLHDELHLALARDFEPSLLHRWLAGLPPLLRHRSLPQQLIVSTSFDTGVERAFADA